MFLTLNFKILFTSLVCALFLFRCPPLAAFGPFHQEQVDRVCEVNVVIYEVSFSGKECAAK